MATGYLLVDAPNPYTAQGTFPRRGGFKPSGTCIVHTSEGVWTDGVASLTRLVSIRTDYGCYHRGCDWEDIVRYYPWSWETWQDSETNNWACGISFACRTSDWGNMPADIEEGFYRNGAQMAADFVRDMKRDYGITVPLRRITGAEARARVPGFCAHGDSGIGRTDPGANFDWKRFFAYTAANLAGEVTPQNEDEKMLIIARKKGTEEVYVGDGITRRHVPNERALGDLQWYASNGILKIWDNGKVKELDSLDGIGSVIAPAAVAEVVLTADDVAALADQLKTALTPSLAAELAKRLAE